MMFLIWPIIFVLTLWGCNEPMAAISEIDKFRVMAIQADPPEIRPGESTTLRVLYADPHGKGRPITFLWLTCLGELKPSDDLSEGCDLVGFQPGSSESGGDSYTVAPLPDDILTDLPEGKTYGMATTLLSACAGGETPTEEDIAGLDGLENVEVLCKGGEHVLAFKTFRISNADDENRNTNPRIKKIEFNNKPLTESVDIETDVGFFQCKTMSKCFDGAKIEATMTKDSFETYEQTQLEKVTVMDEAPYISWFVDGGDFNKNRSRTAEPPGPFKTKWSPPLDGGRFTLWVVAHDLRGGTSWKRYIIRAETPLQE